MLDYLQQQLIQHNISATDEQLQQLRQYIQLLQKWNKVYNLIANADTKEIINRHIIDSLLALPFIQGQRVIDVGSGAGLPGIPLAIMMPQQDFILLDSNGKKTRFMMQAKLALNLNNVEIVQERVENYHPNLLFDVIISRAFAELIKMLNLSKHLAATSAKFIALKGQEQSLEHLPEEFICEYSQRLNFADPTIHRQIVIVRKK